MAAVAVDVGVVFDKAVRFINSEVGDDINSVAKTKELYDKIRASKLALEQQLSLASLAAPSKIKTAVRDADKVTKKIESFSSDQQQVRGDIEIYLADVSPLVRKLASLTGQIDELECYTKYLQWVANIEDLSSDIQSALIINSIERSIKQFTELINVIRQLSHSNCRHLVKFAHDTAIFWHKILRDKFSGEFTRVLSAWHWPFIVSSVVPPSTQTATTEQRDRLPGLFTNLLHLQLPAGLTSDDDNAHDFLSDLHDWHPPLLPITIMLEPLRKRFRYHFHGNKQTNSIDKPEWFFTQVLSWIKDHREFLDANIQPLLLASESFAHIDAVTEFSQGLITLAAGKMHHDIPDLLYDDHLFSHLVDETLAFDRDLRANQIALVPNACLHMFTARPPTFERWIAIERKFAMEKMDAMLSSATAWQCQYQKVADVDSAKVPECAESFVTLLLTITERYRELPSADDRLVFLQLQLDLLDDFRVRLLQVRKEQNSDPLGHCYGAILNTARYIVDVLNEWSELVFFLQLHHHKSYIRRARKTNKAADLVAKTGTNQASVTLPDVAASTSLPSPTSSSLEEGSMFDEIRVLFEHLEQEMLSAIVSYIVDDVKARSRPYRRNKWLALPSQKDATLALSTSACEMLLVLKDWLLSAEQLLSTPLFALFWPRVAHCLNTFIYQEVILTNHFSDGGATQLQFDMTRNLFPLFAAYTLKPENYFKDVKEACLLLSLNTGSTLLVKEVLQQTLHGARGHSDPNNPLPDPIVTLHDIGVFRLKPDDCELILSLKT